MPIQNVIRKGRPLNTKFVATLEGTEAMAIAFANLAKEVRGPIAKAAVTAGLTELAGVWSSNAPIGDPAEGDEHPGLYADALLRPNAIRVAAAAKGANGTLGPRDALTEGDGKPYPYPVILEWGGAGHRAHPVARQSFDSTAPKMAEIVGETVGAGIEAAKR